LSARHLLLPPDGIFNRKSHNKRLGIHHKMYEKGHPWQNTQDYRPTEGAPYFAASGGSLLGLPNVFADLIDVADSTVSEFYFGDSIDKISDTVREPFDF
jgi:hypothetical protein